MMKQINKWRCATEQFLQGLLRGVKVIQKPKKKELFFSQRLHDIKIIEFNY